MKKLNVLLNVIPGVAVGLWGIQALLAYQNYTRHIELFARNGWFWYTDTLEWGKCVVPLVVGCLVVKLVAKQKSKE